MADEYLGWPDLGVPDSSVTVICTLAKILQRARDSESVAIGYPGGHGRTGSALACIAVLTSCLPDEAMDWVRSHYRSWAIEILAQEVFALEFISQSPLEWTVEANRVHFL